MPRAGRAVELLVSMLERLLAGMPVEIRSPDYIIGRFSGSQREVDISLRSNIGSARILVLVECRDRQDNEDVTWIEQLATKREDVGADKAIAVSTVGFTSGAKNMASSKQIELRTLEDVDEAVIFRWLEVQTVQVRVRQVDIAAVTLGLDEDVELTGDIGQAVAGGTIGLGDKFIVRKADGARFSIDDIWQLAPGVGLVLDKKFEGISPGTVKQGTLRITFQSPVPFAIDSANRLADINELVIKGGFYYRDREVPITRRYAYQDNSGSIVEGAEATIEHQGAELTVGLHATPTGSRMSATVIRRDQGNQTVSVDLTAEVEVADSSDDTES